MEAGRHAGGVGGLECETVGDRLARVPDAEFALEQRPVRAADRDVLRFRELDPWILQRGEELSRTERKPAVADAHRIVEPVPLRADVIAIEEGRIERVGIDDVAIPLDQQHVCRLHVVQQRFQHELRIRIARGDRRDASHVHAGRHVDTRRNRIGHEQRAREANALP